MKYDFKTTPEDPKYLYYLKFWGQFEDDLKKILEIEKGDLWFKSETDLYEFREWVIELANEHKKIIATADYMGDLCRYRTVAKIVFKYEGKKYPYEYDFGYGYPESSAEYMFNDGNYSCDCNRSLFLSEKYEGFLDEEGNEFDCDDEIEMISFEVEFR
jgi:hypothetical protein